jgi:hypothetical protein
MDLFDVYVLRFEVNDDRATRALMQVFGMNEGAARIFVHSVPRVGKRDVPTAMAERYVRALHAVGAIVECHRSGTATSLREQQKAAGRPPQLSLPAPPDAAQLGVNTPPHVMQDSLGIMAPLAYSPDMPQIPKAPRLPADLQHIRARKGPDSLAPNWRPRSAAAGMTNTPSSNFEGLGSGPSGATELPSGQIGTANAEPGLWTDPEALAAALHADPMAALRAERAEAGHDHLPREFLDSPEDDAFTDDEPEFVPAKRVVSTESAAPTAPPSKPSSPMSMSPFVAISEDPLKAAGSSEANHNGPATPWYATTTHQLLLAALIIAGMAVALSLGVFETDINRTARAFEQAGIDPGTYEPADRYLSHPTNRFQPLHSDQLQTLVDQLAQAGAREVWVADIQHQDGQRISHTLLLDLPPEASARRALFAALDHTQGVQRPQAPDIGQRFLRVDF